MTADGIVCGLFTFYDAINYVLFALHSFEFEVNMVCELARYHEDTHPLLYFWSIRPVNNNQTKF